MSKDDIRAEIKEKRLALSADEVKEKSEKITSTLRHLRSFSEASTVLFYVPINNEVDVRPLITESFGSKRVCVPKVVGNAIVACEITALDELRVGSYGVLEPITEKRIAPSEIDCALIPGLAFQPTGCRLGYGKGYYDAFLKEVKGEKIGVCYSFQIIDDVPCFKHDAEMDIVVSEEKVYNGG